MLSAGAAFLQRPDWPRIQDGSLTCCWKLSQGSRLEHLDSPPQRFQAAWASHRAPKGINTQHYLYHILIAKAHQNQCSSRGRGKDSSTTLQIHHIYGKKKKGFIIGPLINPIVVYMETSLGRLNPNRVQRNWFTTSGSSSEQSENFSHYLESDFKGA